MATITEQTPFVEHLSRLDRDGALAIAERYRAAGVPELVTGLLAPALIDLGSGWAQGGLGAAEVSAAAGIVRSCLPHLSSPGLGTSDRRRVVAVCCPPGERHLLPAEMLTVLLRNRGWQTLLVGPAVTPEHLPAFLGEHRPVALLVSVTTSGGFPGASRVIRAAHGQGTPVMVGGPAFGRDSFLALRLGAAGWAPSADHAVGVLETWCQRPPALSRASLGPEYLDLAAGLPRILTAATESLVAMNRDNLEPGDRVDIKNDLKLVLARLEAAVLVDDVRVFLDFLTWRRSFDQARGVEPWRLARALLVLTSVVAPDAQRVRQFVDEGRQHLAWLDRAGNEPAPSSLELAGPVRTPRIRDGAPPATRVFLDLLSRLARQTNAPMAFISVPRPDGKWTTFRHSAQPEVGGLRDQLGENRLFSMIAKRATAVEITDLISHPELAPTALARSRGGFRFAYGVPLRQDDILLGVLCVADRQPRQLTGPERDAVTVVARQMTAELKQLREPAPVSRPAPAAMAPPERAPNPDHRAPTSRMMRSREVAALFDVTERTISNWVANGKLIASRTGGGHLRIRSDDVYSLLAERTADSRVA